MKNHNFTHYVFLLLLLLIGIDQAVILLQIIFFVTGIEKGTEYTLFRTDGKRIFSGIYQSEGINTTALAKGTYLLQLKKPKDFYNLIFTKL